MQVKPFPQPQWSPKRLLIASALVGCALGGARAEEYLDSDGKKVVFPLGDVSFADETVGFETGKPSGPALVSDPEQALGPPNYRPKASGTYVTLGCGGVLTFRFVDNALVDVEGPDLYVFEIGPAVEPTELAVSVDATQWIAVGKISGGRAEVDIHDFVEAGDAFHFVRLTDLKSACGGKWPGADIDAVGAIGAGLVISLKGAVLFDVDRFVLKPQAEQELARAAKQIGEYVGATILIDGHTDSTGAEEHNLTLSENRAQAVRDYFVSRAGLDGARIRIHGYGKSRPIAPNDTDEGRERNRRVEIVVIPAG